MTPGPGGAQFLERVRELAAASPYEVRACDAGFDLALRQGAAAPAGGTPAWVHDLCVHLDEEGRRYTVDVRTVDVTADSAGRLTSRPTDRRLTRRDVPPLRPHRFPETHGGALVPEGGWDLRLAENRELVRRAGRDLGWTERLPPGMRAGIGWVVGAVAVLLLLVVVLAVRDLV